MTAEVWGVKVNEARIHTYSGTTDPERWVFYRKKLDRTGRIIVLNGWTPVGDQLWVAAASRDDAVELHAMLLGWGIHKSAIKVRRLRQSDVSAEEWDTVTGYLERMRARHDQTPRQETPTLFEEAR